ncbi:radical SAM family heme chaperone HemW [Flavobacteriaceae bacterium F08102]|nr:radical SAM family heme chaperone HemW [Flavobacteriaceae bacterium F08102]
MAGLYLHIPFCKQACHYCDFHFSTSLKRKEDMIQALISELSMRKDELGSQHVATIYFGGGTPSLLTPSELDRILGQIYVNYSVESEVEITLEANPDDLQLSRIKEYSQGGVNRMSIGVQSFFAPELRMMNRAHTEEEAYRAVADALSVIGNVSIDLIYGIPGLSEERWLENLQMGFDLGIQHLSSYALTVEPKTALAAFIKHKKYPELDENLAATHFEILVKAADDNGFDGYEISNFAKPGFYARHNTSYWQKVPYLGIGPSAHSYSGKHRSWNVANNAKYIKSINAHCLPSENEELSVQDQLNELIMTGLRTMWGIDLNVLASIGEESDRIRLLKAAQKPLQDGLLMLENECLKTTAKGKFLSDGLASDLFFVD